MKAYFAAITLIFLLSCDSQNFEEVPLNKFVGTWELKGRGIYDGIQVQIEEDNTKLTGRLKKLNNNKYVNLFAELDDVWVSGINRSSNFRFLLTEKKIARELFSLYGISSSQNYQVEFIDDDTFGLAGDSKNPRNSSIKYVRVKQ